MQPIDCVKSIDLENPNLEAELIKAFPEHDVVVISGGGTPIAFIHQNEPEVIEEIVELGHEVFLSDLLVYEPYYCVPQLSDGVVFTDFRDATNEAFLASESSIYTRREKPPDN